ncbi:hypothetical protein ABIE50_004924 [Chitinophaga sp. OAE865]
MGGKKDNSTPTTALSLKAINLRMEVQKLNIESKLTSRFNDTLYIKWRPDPWGVTWDYIMKAGQVNH